MTTTRRLPHIYPEDRWLFLTWHLHGSLRPAQFQPAAKALSGEAFVLMDKELDNPTTGPMFLGQDAIASLMKVSLFWGEKAGNYDLAAWVIMANQVHALLLPKIAVSALMKSLKGYTAREANKRLARTSTPFWQKESYDHWVRSADEWIRIKSYIENNPVKAGLASSPEDYQWSSPNHVDTTVDAARLEPRATRNRLGETPEP